MARIVKEEEYTTRRNEILDAALRFIYSKGYEQMTIKDILDDLHISKGAFYHYFDSKDAVLEAVVTRLMDEVEPLLLATVQDQSLSALEKLHRYFDTAARWKSTKKDLMLALMRIWYADENAIVRHKMFNATLERITPLLTEIIRQGVREGVFNTAYPEYVGLVNVYLLQGLSDTFVNLLLSGEPDGSTLNKAEIIFEAYNDALERVLGAPKGCMKLIEIDTLKEWFVSPEAVN
jgi:AcrR family transcriptional regulator